MSSSLVGETFGVAKIRPLAGPLDFNLEMPGWMSPEDFTLWASHVLDVPNNLSFLQAVALAETGGYQLELVESE